jgi:hypothetical protein
VHQCAASVAHLLAATCSECLTRALACSSQATTVIRTPEQCTEHHTSNTNDTVIGCYLQCLYEQLLTKVGHNSVLYHFQHARVQPQLISLLIRHSAVQPKSYMKRSHSTVSRKQFEADSGRRPYCRGVARLQCSIFQSNVVTGNLRIEECYHLQQVEHHATENYQYFAGVHTTRCKIAKQLLCDHLYYPVNELNVIVVTMLYYLLAVYNISCLAYTGVRTSHFEKNSPEVMHR